MHEDFRRFHNSLKKEFDSLDLLENPLEQFLFDSLTNFPRELTRLISSFTIEHHKTEYEKYTTINGLKHGKYICINPSETIECLYQMGVLQGTHHMKSIEMGPHTIISNYKDGILHGRYILKKWTGLTKQYFINQGVVDGPACILKDNKLVGKAHYKNNMLDGEYTCFSEQNDLISHKVYENGTIIKVFIPGPDIFKNNPSLHS